MRGRMCIGYMQIFCHLPFCMKNLFIFCVFLSELMTFKAISLPPLSVWRGSVLGSKTRLWGYIFIHWTILLPLFVFVRQAIFEPTVDVKMSWSSDLLDFTFKAMGDRHVTLCPAHLGFWYSQGSRDQSSRGSEKWLYITSATIIVFY